MQLQHQLLIQGMVLMAASADYFVPHTVLARSDRAFAQSKLAR
jgi:hypothetical protein